MKYILVCFLLLFGHNVISQSRIGFTESEIRKEFYDIKFTVKYSDGSNTRYIIGQTESTVRYYYFNAEGRCYTCYIKPKNQGTLNTMVEQYNKMYVIVSDTEWKMYLEGGGIIRCKLLLLDDEYYFNYEAA